MLNKKNNNPTKFLKNLCTVRADQTGIQQNGRLLEWDRGCGRGRGGTKQKPSILWSQSNIPLH